jgi:hypothetical protein
MLNNNALAVHHATAFASRFVGLEYPYRFVNTLGRRLDQVWTP